MAHNNTPRVAVYGQNGSTFTPITQSLGITTGDGRAIAMSPDSGYMAFGKTDSNAPFLYVFARSGNSFVSTGVSISAQPAGVVQGLDFSPDGTLLAVAHGVSPFVTVYTKSGGTFTKLTGNFDVLPTNTGNRVKFSPDGNFLLVSTNVTGVLLYQRSGNNFTKVTAAALPTNTTYSMTFTPDSAYLAIASAQSPFLFVYQFNSGAPVKVADSANIPTAACYTINFNHTGTMLSVGTLSASPFLYTYSFSAGALTKLPDPDVLPAGNVTGITYTTANDYLCVGAGTTPFIYIYSISGTTFTKVADPTTLPGGPAFDISSVRIQG
jgi:WD40 repeat protein